MLGSGRAPGLCPCVPRGVNWAERGVSLSHRQTPKWLLLSAQAYHFAGQMEKARSAANV